MNNFFTFKCFLQHGITVDIECGELLIELPENEFCEELVHKLRLNRDKIYKMASLRSLIKMISDFHGGDSTDFLTEYIDSVITNYWDNLDTAIQCFEKLKSQYHL